MSGVLSNTDFDHMFSIAKSFFLVAIVLFFTGLVCGWGFQVEYSFMVFGFSIALSEFIKLILIKRIQKRSKLDRNQGRNWRLAILMSCPSLLCLSLIIAGNVLVG